MSHPHQTIIYETSNYVDYWALNGVHRHKALLYISYYTNKFQIGSSHIT